MHLISTYEYAIYGLYHLVREPRGQLPFCAVPEGADFRISIFLRVPRAGLAATPDVRSMAPSKRRKTSAVSQPASGNASSGVQTRRSANAPGDPPNAPDADLDAEPEELMCPITRAVFRDPVFVVDSGHTYERSAILSHFERNGAKDPLTRRALSSTKVMTDWAMRNVVQAWLDKHPGVTPDGWDSRELLEPSKDDGIQSFDDEGDVGVLRTWRAMCPALQDRWPEAARPEDWAGVTIGFRV
jgi:leucine-rich repeat protein SHOC2